MATALAGCGGGGTAPSTPPTNAAVDTGSSILTSGPIALPPSSALATPAFHMLPVVLDAPSNIDADGYEASARVPPLSVHVPVAMANLATAGLTPQALASAAAAAASQPASIQSAGRAIAADGLPSTVYTPAQIRAAYGLPSLTGSTPAALGGGQTIYIVDAYDNPNALSDLNLFSAKYGLPTCTSAPIAVTAKLPLPAPAAGSGCTLSVVYPGAAALSMNATAPAYSSGWAPEIALDIQWAHAIAPMARIVLLEATNNGVTNLANAAQLAGAMGPGAVSMSFGSPESSFGAAGVVSYDVAFAGPGVTYLASTGDSGTSVSWPSVSSKVLAVGGTSLSYSGTGVRFENTWSGTGGGISAFVPLPGYQTGLKIAGPSNTTVAAAMRTVADVSFNADPNTGQYVVITAPGGPTKYYAYGGTSISSPQWAGLIAIANATRAASGKSAIGDAHSALYAALASPGTYASAFADVNAGRDGSCVTCSAGASFDAPTGLGTPNAAGVIALLAGASSLPPLPASSMPSGAAGKAYSTKWAATDAAGGALTYTLSAGATAAPSGMVVSTAGIASWAAPVAGVYNFTAVVKNSSGQQAQGPVSLTIAAALTPGSVGLSGTAGTPFSYGVGASTNATGPLTYALAGAPAGLTISLVGSVATMSWAAPVAGNYQVTLTVSDSFGQSASAMDTLTISPPTPVVPGGSLSAVAGTPLLVGLGITKTTALTSFSLAGAPVGMAITAGGQLSWSAPVPGTFAFTVSAATGTSIGHGSYTLTVTAPPVAAVVPGGKLSILGGSTGSKSLGITVSGVAPVAPLTYLVSGAPTGTVVNSAGMLTWANPQPGLYAMTVTAKTSSGLTSTGIYQVTVMGPPVITTPATAFTGYAGAPFSGQIAATDASINTTTGPLTYALTAGPSGVAVPAGLAISSTGKLSWAAPVAKSSILEGQYQATVVVTNAAGLHASVVIALNVIPVPTGISFTTTAHAPNTWAVNVSNNPSGYPQTFTLVNAPAVMVANANGNVGWVHTVRGNYSVRVIITNPGGVTGSALITLTVS